MRKLIVIYLFLLILLFTNSCSKNDEYIRLRIIANSNSSLDINDKTMIKEVIKDLFDSKKLDYNSLNIESLRIYLKEELDEELFNKLNISKCISYYPAKAYNNKFIPSGNYETLLIEINEGKGNNFWTLLYPEYFGFEFEESNEIEFRSYFYDRLS